MIRPPPRYLWVMWRARSDEALPLTCPRCGAEMRIIAFMAEAVDVRAILEPIGEPATPPRIGQARGPPESYEASAEAASDGEACLSGDPLAQPAPESAYDQRVSWSSGPPRGCRTGRCRLPETPPSSHRGNRLQHPPAGRFRRPDQPSLPRRGLGRALTVPPDGGNISA